MSRIAEWGTVEPSLCHVVNLPNQTKPPLKAKSRVSSAYYNFRNRPFSVRRCLDFTADCGLSQTARWAVKPEIKNMVEEVRKVKKQPGI